VQCARERIENESQVFQGYHAQQCRIAGLAEDFGTVTFAHGKGDVALGDVAFDSRSVSKGETGGAFRSKSDRCPNVERHERIVAPLSTRKSSVRLPAGPVTVPSTYVIPMGDLILLQSVSFPLFS
jgi:hypothetical protein